MDIAATLPIWSIIPFVGMLLSIAIMPLTIPAWYERHQLLVAGFWALLFCIPFGIAYGGHELAYQLAETVILDYVPFIVLLFGLFFSLYFPMRATNSLMAAVRTAYHLGPPKGFITQWIKVLLYTVTLIVTIALTLSLMTFGERALWYTVEHFHLPEFLAKLWVTLRFPVAGAVSFLALFLLYALAQDTIQPLKNIYPGVLFSLAAWMAFSWLYSYYVNHFSHYSVLYGSIGAVIVVLIWLNLSAFTLILGAEMNGVLISMRKDRLEQDTNVPKA